MQSDLRVWRQKVSPPTLPGLFEHLAATGGVVDSVHRDVPRMNCRDDGEWVARP